MDISKQITKELVEMKAVLKEALSQNKTGARQAAPGKTSYNPDTESARALRLQTHTVMKESQRGGPAVSRDALQQSWEKGFKIKMMHDAMQRVGTKGSRGLVTTEQLQMMMNSKEFK